MRKVLITVLLLLATIQAPRFHAAAQGTAPAADEPPAGSVVCPPGVYSQPPSDCLPLGPSAALASLAAEGVPYQPLPLPAYPMDPGLADIPFRYFKLTVEGQAIYL